jgi:DNA helicase-2/ATP-dependent DNA helicase PcrA
MSASEFIRSLSDEQYVAATYTDNPVLALAGAGSGKTRMLVGRFNYLIAPPEQGGLGADPGSIMMVTFTNKAAREMRERIQPFIDEIKAANPRAYGEPWIGTFHGLSLRILRIEAEKADLGRNFSIFDESDSKSLLDDVVDEMELEHFDADEFFSDLETAKARMLAPDYLQKIYSQAVQATEDQSLKDDVYTQTQLKRWRGILRHFQSHKFIDVYAAYQDALQEQNAVDFNDLLNRTTKLFQSSPEVRDSWRSSFRHFMIDEVQDINRAQVSWLSAITNGGGAMSVDPDHQNATTHGSATDGLHEINTYRISQFPRPTIAFVGDDDQSIYAFRGSDVRVMRGLENRFEGLEKKFLATSYRCQPNILDAANALVGVNTGRFGKDLKPVPGADKFDAVRIKNYFGPQEEITAIAREAEAYIEAGGDPMEFAVLTRTRNLGKAVAKELRNYGLPVVEGKAADLRKTAEVKDVMGFVTFLMNPDAEVPLRRVINKPSRGLGPTSIRKVVNNARLKGHPFLQEMKAVMDGKIEIPRDGDVYPKAFQQRAKEFGHMLNTIQDEIRGVDAKTGMMSVLRQTQYLNKLYDDALKSVGLVKQGHDAKKLEPREFLKWVLKNNKESSDADKKFDVELEGEDLADRAGQLSESARRIGNIALLLDECAGFESLQDFAQESVLEMNEAPVPNGIQVQTMHGSKGLEFDHVRLPFWIEGVMPHGRAVEEGEDEVEEERRLAYVSLTRARKTCVVTRPMNLPRGSFILQRSASQSRFIEELKAAPYGAVRFIPKQDISFAFETAPITTTEAKVEAKAAERKAEAEAKAEKQMDDRPFAPADASMDFPADMPQYDQCLGPNGYAPVNEDEISYEDRFADMPPPDYDQSYSAGPDRRDEDEFMPF